MGGDDLAPDDDDVLSVITDIHNAKLGSIKTFKHHQPCLTHVTFYTHPVTNVFVLCPFKCISIL